MIQFLPLSSIFVDYTWNVRTERNVRASESDAVRDEDHVSQGEGLKGLKQTLALRGQDAPVIVRPVSHGVSIGGRKTNCPFELLVGFRRFTAVSELPAVPGVPVGCIRAEVREIGDREAVLLNARENTDRQNLSVPELLCAVQRLAALGLSEGQIGYELSINRSYVGRLLAVSKLPESVLSHWRGETKIPGRENMVDAELTVNELYQLKVQADRESLLPHQIFERYVLALTPRRTVQHGHRGVGIYMKRVHDVATLVARLVRAGVVLEGDLDWSLVIGSGYDGYPIDVGPDCHDLLEKYFKIAQSAYAAAKEGKSE